MTGCRIPGPEDGRVKIDKGTLARSRMNRPGCIGTDSQVSKTSNLPPCTGNEKTYIANLGEVESYRGDFPSPLQAMWYVPEGNEMLKGHFSDSEIRRWIKEAARYHGIPHVMLAVILQQENGPNATTFQKVGQFAERSLTTFAAIMDDSLFDAVPDVIAGGSSGFANMSRGALRSAAAYSEDYYGRNPLSPQARYRLLGWDQDTRISGDDWKADLYYCAAHLRQLIDQVTGGPCHNGPLTLDQVKRVFYRYNGSGDMAKKYAEDAMQTLLDAVNGQGKLYFYEK